MNLHRSLLVTTLALLAPLQASAAINTDPGDGGGGGETGGGDTDGVPTFKKTYTKSGYYGTSGWGAGYAVNGTVSATPAYDTYKDKLAANMSLVAYTKLNGGYNQLFAVRTIGATEAKRRTDLSFNAYVGSANIYSKSYTSTTSTYSFPQVPSWTKPSTFVDKSVTVNALIVPVTFRVKATGELRADLSAKISNIGAEASAAPSGKASLYASAAIGGQYCVAGLCVGATAGVYADVTLVKAAAPASVAAWWSLSPYGGVLVNYLAKADLTLSTLDGELGLFAEACLGACISDSIKLIDWNGFSASYSIANVSGKHCLIGTCSLPTMPTSPLPLGL